MSGMVLTPVSPTLEKSTERQGSTPESERPAEGFDAVSAREKARLERKEARQDRADRQAEDSRIADRKAEQQGEETRTQQADNQRADKKGAEKDDAGRPSRADSDTPSTKETAGTQKAEKADVSENKDGAVGDEVLPMLFAVPTPQEGGPQPATGVKLGTAGQVGTMPTASTVMDKLMNQPLQGQASSGNGSDGDALLGAKGDQLGALMGKAAGDGKGLDFSAQLTRFQGGNDSATQQNNATSLQRGLEGRESMATLKSYSTSVDLPVQHAQWGEKVAGKLAWLTNQRMSAAEIHITPPDLGPLEVRVQVQHDQAQVTVHATHSVVRDQLELNSHRLRDMLQENGLNLDKFEVSAESSDQGAQQHLAGEGGSGDGRQALGAESELDSMGEPVSGGNLDLSWRGEVDLYA